MTSRSCAAALLVLAAACERSGPPASSAGASGGVASNQGAGKQVTITGEIEKSYTPEEVSAVKIANHVGINLNEKTPCGVTLQFPDSIKAGSHPIGDRLSGTLVPIFGEYGTFCGDDPSPSQGYQSTRGTLTITSPAPNWAGRFDFTAARARDPSKTIQVSGSFSGAAVP